MFTMTRAAAQQILAASERSDAASMALRVAARQEAGGSIGYGMGFDEPREHDSPLQFEGLTVLIAPHSEPLLQDTVLDFVELAPGDFNFIFTSATETPPEPPARACGSGGCSGCGG
jgi:iron-sulfur cluster assembly protein